MPTRRDRRHVGPGEYRRGPMSVDRLRVGTDGVTRCWWCGDDPLYVQYHDSEWGRPVTDDTRLFEKLCLEGFQSGLSWLTILRKRENFRSCVRGVRPGGGGRVRRGRRAASARRCRHRAPPGQDREHDQQRQSRCWPCATSAGRCTRTCRSSGPRATNLTVDSELRATCPESRGDVEGPQAARLVVRRPHHGVRLHAGDGPGRRSHPRLRAGRVIARATPPAFTRRRRNRRVPARRRRPASGCRGVGGAVPPRDRARRRWLHRRRRVLRAVRLPHHPPVVARAAPGGFDIAAIVLGPSRPAVTARRPSSSWSSRSVASTMLSPLSQQTLGHDAIAVGVLRRQLALRRAARGLLRCAARRGQPVAAAALLVARRGGAVLPRVAAADAAREPSAAPLPPVAQLAGGGDHHRFGGHLGVDDPRQPDLRVLSAAGAHGRAAGRRWSCARCAVHPHGRRSGAGDAAGGSASR